MTEIPDKPFYKIGEVCQYTDTQPYVLRFWESEFPQLAPEKNRNGQRVYRRQDIELIFRIKKLLYEEEYTIAGARKRLEDGDEAPPPKTEPAAPGGLIATGEREERDEREEPPYEAPAREAPRQAALFAETGSAEAALDEPPATPQAPAPHVAALSHGDGDGALHREIDRLHDAVLRAEAARIAAEAERDAYHRRFERTAKLLEELAERLDREADSSAG